MHLFTPRNAGAKEAGSGYDGQGERGGSAGRRAKERRKGEVDSKQEKLSVMYLIETQQHNTKSCFERKQPHRHTE